MCHINTDSPDRHIYDYDPNFKRHPLRSFAPNTHNFPRFVGGGSETVVEYGQIGELSGDGIYGYPKRLVPLRRTGVAGRSLPQISPLGRCIWSTPTPG